MATVFVILEHTTLIKSPVAVSATKASAIFVEWISMRS